MGLISWDYKGNSTIYQLVQDFATIHRMSTINLSWPNYFYTNLAGSTSNEIDCRSDWMVNTDTTQMRSRESQIWATQISVSGRITLPMEIFISHRIHVWYICYNIWGIWMVNVTIYSIHGSYGICSRHMFFSFSPYTPFFQIEQWIGGMPHDFRCCPLVVTCFINPINIHQL
jgi:hypothetical protein